MAAFPSTRKEPHCSTRRATASAARANGNVCTLIASLFWRSSWKITPQSNRYGYRLQGPAVKPISPIEKRSHGIVPGVIQIPPNGEPIIQMRDAQTSGGYPKIATVIRADLWRAGQTPLGGKLRFEQTAYTEAIAAEAAVSAYLDRLRANVRLVEEIRTCR